MVQNNKIICIDDQPALLEDYQRILSPPSYFNRPQEMKALEEALFGQSLNHPAEPELSFEVFTATQGNAGWELVKAHNEQQKPFAVAFIDVRMPPGWDGIETARRIREIDKLIEIVIVTAFSDKQRSEFVELVGMPEKLLYLRKPFDPEEIRQLALALSRKWTLEREAEAYRDELELKVKERTDELRRKDLELIQMDRIVGTSTLAAGVAHEINNPVGFIKSSFELYRKNAAKLISVLNFWEKHVIPQPLREAYAALLDSLQLDTVRAAMDRQYERIDRGINRITKIVNCLKSFSRIDQSDIGELNLNESINEALELVTARDVSLIEFRIDLKEIPVIRCIAGEINQCLLHVLNNAVDAIENDGVITVKTTYDPVHDQVMVEVLDTGIGMDEVVLSQVFNPFFTTKPVGSGTGIGLSITERIIKRHGGRIECFSKPGEGTRLVMLLPRTMTV